jgi:8-oxo-dGTP pyrophosphatase MutT (NUDIX family)
MVRRNRDSAFMGGAHVFPGGAVDDVDRGPLASQVVAWDGTADELPWRSAAVRELAEEAGVLLCDEPPVVDGAEGEVLYRVLARHGATLDAGRLEYLSNWVTPEGPSRRFDTRFFVTVVAEGTEAASDRREVFDAEWVTPSAALAAAVDGTRQIELPTRVHLELLAGFTTADDVVEHARRAVPHPIEPRIAAGPGGAYRVLIPGDAGTDEVP